MATNIKSNSIGGIFIQSGNGIPNHIATIGTIFIDIDIPSGHLSNGNGSWVDLGSVSSGSTFDVFVTGGTFNNISDDITFTNNTGGTFNVTGLTDYYTTATTKFDDVIYFNRNDSMSAYTASTALSSINNRLIINDSSTGVIVFTGISTASTVTFNVSPIKGWIIDNYTDATNPTKQYIEFSGINNVNATFVTAATESYILLTSGGTILQQVTFPTPQERRQNIYLGQLGHGTKTTILNVFNEPDITLNVAAQLRDMFAPINLINDGIVATANGVNLSFNTSAGTLYGLGIGFVNNILTPDNIPILGNVSASFQYRTQTGGTGSTITSIIPSNYDVNGIVTPIPGANNRASNQRIFMLQNGIIRVQYGQEWYTNLTNAISGLDVETFVNFPNFKQNAILIGILSVRKGATDLSDPTDAKFTFVSKFGEVFGGTGGIATTTLQQAYNNSISPEIIINSTLDGFSLQNGTGNSDTTTHLLEGLNSGGTVTSFITGDGGISGSSITGNTFTVNQINGLSATTAQTINLLLSDQFIYTLSGNTTFTFSNNANGKSWIVAVNTNPTTSGYTGTFTATTASVKWPYSITPVVTSATSKTDIFQFSQLNNIIYGNYSQSY